MSSNKKMDAIKKRILFKVNAYTILTMCVAVLIDMGGGYLATSAGLPFWLDMIGTMIVAIQFGPLAGAFIGAVSSSITYLINGSPEAYAMVGATVGLFIGIFYPRKNKDETLSMVSVGIIAALIAAAITVPLNFLYFDGNIGNVWGDAAYDFLGKYVNNPRINSFIASAFIEIPDKVISIFIAALLVKLETVLFLRPNGKKGGSGGKGSKKKKEGAVVSSLLILALAIGLIPGSNVQAADYQSDFESTIFGSKDGLPSSEINAVAQTKDGYIWIGTYSGLYLYDGIRFEKATMKTQISSVISLFVDSAGRLWVGTNDSGAIVYDVDTFEYKTFNKSNGLTSNSIRCIGEDTKGNIYLGTSLALSRIDRNDQVTSLTDEMDLYYTETFYPLSDGTIVGVSNAGVLYRLREDRIIFTTTFQRENGVYYRGVTGYDDMVLVGNSKNSVDRFRIGENDLVYQDETVIPDLEYINKLVYNKDSDGVFVCCENGMGFLDRKTGVFTRMSKSGFDCAVEDAFIDYQGNLWFASSKQGLIKFSFTQFQNPFMKADVDAAVANAILLDDNMLYIGTDVGLRLIDLTTMKQVDRPYLSSLENMRIRNIMKDSVGNLWFSTYSEEGLICVSPSGELSSFNEKKNGFLGMQCRTTIELSDGSVLGSSKSGLTYIKDGKVTHTIGVSDGLKTSMILTMYEREDGSVLAGSDGDGIYVIKDHKLIGHIGEKEGLKTAVVMRIVKCTGGYLYVTSDSLYYDNGRSIKQLNNFPYTNNFDVLITEDGYCWITSSAGLYQVKEDDLLKNEGSYPYILMNEDWGLKTSFTANSWSKIDHKTLYLCCTDGIRILNTEKLNSQVDNYHMQLKFIETSDERIFPQNGKFVIPAEDGRINFSIAVNNSSLSNPIVHYYLEGSSDDGITCPQSEILPLSFTDLPYGEYQMHIDILGTDESVVQSKVIRVEKEALMYEKLYFKLYAMFVILSLVAYVCWIILTIHRKTMSIIGLQREISTDPMTGLLNKAGSTKALQQACREDTGILMMIDLDSFKLVNDLYGHDMGDKILIRFAELIKGALGDNDITGRIGGDEFIGYMRHVTDEENVDRLTRYLNRELVKSAKEYMGEDMNIPLGTSIGAVRVPMEGTEFEELHKLADKALYVVKQNGKHGYSFYQKKGNTREQDSGETDNNSFEQIKQIIGERNEGKGAYAVNFDKLQVIYKFLNRNDRMNETTTGFLRFTLEGDTISDEAKDAFEEFLIVKLRKNDVVSRYSGRFFVLCTGIGEEGLETTASRIRDGWAKCPDNHGTTVEYEIETVG